MLLIKFSPTLTLQNCRPTLPCLLPLSLLVCTLPFAQAAQSAEICSLQASVAVQIWVGLKVPKGKSDIFQATQVLRVLLQRSRAFCQAGRKEPVFSQKSAWKLVSDRLIYHTPESFNKLRMPILLVEDLRLYLQFAIFLQAATWSNSFGISVPPFSLQLLSRCDPEVFCVHAVRNKTSQEGVLPGCCAPPKASCSKPKAILPTLCFTATVRGRTFDLICNHLCKCYSAFSAPQTNPTSFLTPTYLTLTGTFSSGLKQVWKSPPAKASRLASLAAW